MDIEEYLPSGSDYEKNGVEHTNDERGIKRKLAPLSAPFTATHFKTTLIKMIRP